MNRLSHIGRFFFSSPLKLLLLPCRSHPAVVLLADEIRALWGVAGPPRCLRRPRCPPAFPAAPTLPSTRSRTRSAPSRERRPSMLPLPFATSTSLPCCSHPAIAVLEDEDQRPPILAVPLGAEVRYLDLDLCRPRPDRPPLAPLGPGSPPPPFLHPLDRPPHRRLPPLLRHLQLLLFADAYAWAWRWGLGFIRREIDAVVGAHHTVTDADVATM